MELEKEELVELTGYLRNIKSYEKDIQLSENATANMISGLFIMLAGIGDFNSALYSGASPHFIPWVFGIAFMYITHQIIGSQPLLFEDITDEKIERVVPSKSMMVISAILMLLTAVVGSYDHRLVIPYVGIAFGTLTLFFNRNSSDTKGGISFIVGSFYSSAIVVLVGGFLIHEVIFLLAGLIFGIIEGSAFIVLGRRQRSKVTDNYYS